MKSVKKDLFSIRKNGCLTSFGFVSIKIINKKFLTKNK